MLGITYPVADNGDTGLVKGFCERVEGESERSVCYHGLFEAERYREDLRPTPEDLAHLCKAGDTQCEAELNRYVMDPWDTVFGVQLSQL